VSIEREVFSTDLLPSTLALSWGMSREQCEAALRAQPSEPRLASLLPAYQLHFEQSGALARLRIDAAVSRDFWEDFYEDIAAQFDDPRVGLDAAYAAEDAIKREYEDRFGHLIARWSKDLGPPTWRGSWLDEDYPVLEEWGDLAFWDHADGRLQITLMKQDRELPWVVAACCYLPPDPGDAGVLAEMAEAREVRNALRNVRAQA
jgi:hypothetical protein